MPDFLLLCHYSQPLITSTCLVLNYVLVVIFLTTISFTVRQTTSKSRPWLRRYDACDVSRPLRLDSSSSVPFVIVHFSYIIYSTVFRQDLMTCHNLICAVCATVYCLLYLSVAIINLITLTCLILMSDKKG